MNHFPPFLASLDIEEVSVPWHTPSGTAKATFVLLGAMVLVASILLIWAAFFRKHRRQHSQLHHHHHHPSTGQPPTAEANALESIAAPHKRRRRRRRRDHRPRNPTLAETGGLPPVRADKPSEPLP
ncbi:MAG TPA: hypothetical protein VNZ64_25960 [Candidatus Acidoferrum sp.]|nr:hypothetical protein [Candidatus Acidoferrum sp.]